ncbi:Uncharacterized protein Adt_02908 [Abeliophyllum distichum]|uniref:Uncharacterized protein n=1 Tax=Abeliophyllum distichum TaxID=126358 RepID=A0ABD1VXB3_9LAMI
MSSDHEDSQNRSDPGTDPEVMGEASSSSSLSSSPSVGGQEDIDQGAPSSTSGRGENPAVLPKTKAGLDERANDPPEDFVSIYESTMLQGLCLPLHPFFHEVLREWNLAPCQRMVRGIWSRPFCCGGLWRLAEIYPPSSSSNRTGRSAGWYNVSPRPGQKWGTETDSPNKVHNWKDRFFFAGGGWEFLPEDPRLEVTIHRQFGDLSIYSYYLV